MNVEGRCGQEEDHLLFCEMLITRVREEAAAAAAAGATLLQTAAAAKFSCEKGLCFKLF